MTQTIQPVQEGKRNRTFGSFWKRMFEVGLLDLLLGFCLRRSFAVAGVLKVTPGWPLPRIINSGGRIEAESCRFFPGVRIECWHGAVLKIGKGTYFNRGTEIVASSAVFIGADCKIARDVIIMDTDQHPLDATGLKMNPVVIEDRVWLGSRAIVLKGVCIGHDSIVGAGAIVTKSVPPYSVVVGPAARVIKTLQP
jgi:acetyltransferase-like isoleucine patch superfamily enzyme